MAFFSNSDGLISMAKQCEKCIWSERPCPVHFVQFSYNYEACNNSIAREILDSLWNNNAECLVYKEFESDLKKDTSCEQQDLFGGK